MNQIDGMKYARVVLSIVGWIVSSAGLRVSADLVEREGKYIHLTSDIESAEQCDSLVASFDAAVPQWLDFWNLTERDVEGWKVRACVMREKQRFHAAGLIPASVPDFPFGYTLDDHLWVLVQDSEYYTRHLLLHEGAHAIAFHQFQGAGPTWFMEGTAEMLATHRGVGETIEINQIPANRESVPYWGRFKLMDQLREQNRVPSIETVMQYQPNLLGKVDAYGWSWVATAMMRAYPEYRDAFMASARNGRDTSSAFNRRLFLKLRDQWPVIHARWRVTAADLNYGLNYGFDWDVERIEISERDPLWDGKPISVAIAANRGWQSIGARVPAGARIQLAATGEVILSTDPKPWVSEPTGITFRYHRGRPLGQLIALVLPNAIVKSPTIPAPTIQSVSEGATMEINQTSWLLLRVNDSPDGQADNTGQYQITVGP